jgi:cation:H+ antiporter
VCGTQDAIGIQERSQVQTMSMSVAILVFLTGAGAILVVGTRLTTLADRLADRTGLGEAFMGAVFLGAVTSLPGITASVVAAIDGRPQMALSNAIGGIAAQTAFLALADIAYRKANLEHAAASVPNMMQATVLIIILSMVLMAMAAPGVSFWAIHPITPAMFLVYLFGMSMVRRAAEEPMWLPRQTDRTETDEADEDETPTSADWGMWSRFAISAVVVMVAGFAITRAVEAMSDDTEWMHESIAGALFTAVATSLPELVTSIAAVRRGALTLAVGGIIGGNCFDTLFAAAADIAYRDGSLFHAAATADGGFRELVLIAVSITMTAVLLLGLLRRQKDGPGGIGFESITVLALYAGALVLVAIT